MVTVKIIPDRERLAVLRAGRLRRLLGPGIVVHLAWPGTRYQRIAIGDRGQLITLDQARFGAVSLPVALRGAATSGAVRVAGFRADAIVVAGEDGDAAAGKDVSPPEREAAAPTFKPRHFWIGLPVIMLFAAVTWGGVLYAWNQIRIEQQVHARGVLTTGRVTEKTMQQHHEDSRSTYYVAYAFRTPSRYTVRNEVNVESALWHRLQEGGDIAVRYLPDDPAVNLPDGRRLAEKYYWAGGFALAGALLFSAILVGMLVKKFAGGYRGETHPFLGERTTRRGQRT